MKTEFITIYGNERDNHLDLSVTVQGSEIRIESGQFKISGTAYELDDEVAYTPIGDADHPTDIIGYLALDSSGSVQVVVDRWVLDGLNPPFTFSGDSYKLLSKLFSLKIPARAVDHTDVVVRIIRIIPKPDTEDSGGRRQ